MTNNSLTSCTIGEDCQGAHGQFQATMAFDVDFRLHAPVPGNSCWHWKPMLASVKTTIYQADACKCSARRLVLVQS